MMNARLDDQFDDENTSILSLWGEKISRTMLRPANLGWTVGGALAIGFVFSNALFFQTGEHPAAMFETRSKNMGHALRSDEMIAPSISSSDVAAEKSVTRIVFDENSNSETTNSLPPKITSRPAVVEAAVQPVQASEPASTKQDLAELQGFLAELGFYKGAVDGLPGPKTSAAIEEYKGTVGLRGIELSVAELALSARNNLIVTAAIKTNRPQVPVDLPVPTRKVETVSYTPPTPQGQTSSADSKILKVQAGLRAFGNSDISVDGQIGPQTVDAIKEFQGVFKLPVTGTIDQALVDKMASVGLIN